MVLRNSRRGKSQNRHSADTTSRNLNSTQAATHETEEDLKLYLSTLEQMNNEYEVRFCQPCWDLVEIWFDFNDLYITFICVLRAWHLYFDFKIIETNCCSIWQVVIFSRILTPQLSCIISFRRSSHGLTSLSNMSQILQIVFPCNVYRCKLSNLQYSYVIRIISATRLEISWT